MFGHMFGKRKTAEIFVHALYSGLLNREPGPSDMLGCVETILAGRSYASVLQEFANCSERL